MSNEVETLKDEWEHFTVTFSLHYPLDNENEFMRINGDTDKLGNWNKGKGPLKMEVGNERIWLTGEKVKPWEMQRVRWSNVPDSGSKMPDKLIYKYSLYNQKEETIWEREPSRELKILDPKDYMEYKSGEMMKGENKAISNKGLLEWHNVN